jgi:hypothetical protein
MASRLLRSADFCADAPAYRNIPPVFLENWNILPANADRNRKIVASGLPRVAEKAIMLDLGIFDTFCSDHGLHLGKGGTVEGGHSDEASVHAISWTFEVAA